jgi:protein-L-isoaspartate(D-aspartate) O-methyltransferase
VELLQEQGIKNLAVLHAIDQTPRHLFVPTGVRHRAYEDSALPIGNGQTISLDVARETIRQVGSRNISFLLGDGTLGWRQYAPYDAILVGAGAPEVPSTYHEQLTEGGRILIPLGDREEQTLYMFTRRGEKLEQEEIAPVRFVPLVGKYSWEGL